MSPQEIGAQNRRVGLILVGVFLMLWVGSVLLILFR